MNAVRYRNVKTGSVSTYAVVMARLEASPKWERVKDDEPKPAPPPTTNDD